MGLSSLGGANVEFTHSHVFAVKYTVPVCEMEREKKYTWVFKVFFFLLPHSSLIFIYHCPSCSKDGSVLDRALEFRSSAAMRNTSVSL